MRYLRREIFTAQYHGTGNTDGVRYTFRFKIIVNLLTAAVGIAIFLCFGDGLISLFLHADGSGADTALTLAEGKKYLLAALLRTYTVCAFSGVFVNASLRPAAP